MVVFNTAGYYGAPVRDYGDLPELQVDNTVDIEKPIMPIKEIGGSVTEGSRFGSLIQSATGAIRQGVGKLELATIQGGGEPGGVESYGKEARQALREQSKASGTEIVSVHTPVQIGNLSGFNPQQGFVDEQRHVAIEEVKKAIQFAGEVAGGGAVVVHTGEFQRPMTEQKWALNPDGTYKFINYEEEPGRAVKYLVDDRTGEVIPQIRKSQIIREPVYLTSGMLRERGEKVDEYRPDGLNQVRDTDWVTEEGKYVNPRDPDDLFRRVPLWDKEHTRFHTRKLGWNEIVERTNQYNRENNDNIAPEVMAYRIQMETQMLQYRGSSLYHGREYDEYRLSMKKLKEALKYYQRLEEHTLPEEQWKLLRHDREFSRYAEGAEFTPGKYKLPSELIKKAITNLERQMRYVHEASASADAQADQIKDRLDHVNTIEKYALNQSTKSYAELGIAAMRESESNPHVTKDIFVAPENIFPEMGYGSHPEEMIDLVKKSRKKMIQYLTEEKIPDPHGRRDRDGNLYMISNPYYDPSISREQARKEAETHIKATLDTQHLGMWRKHFVSLPNETRQETDRRFNKWYMEQIEKLQEENIIGHIHLVDAMGGGHHHLPAGQGNLPLVDAITYLKKKGYDGTIISEAHEENARFGAARQLTETWKTFGSPIYSTGVPIRFGPTSWQGMEHGYFGRTMPPMFIYGTYAPSNDWTLWSQVPME